MSSLWLNIKITLVPFRSSRHSNRYFLYSYIDQIHDSFQSMADMLSKNRLLYCSRKNLLVCYQFQNDSRRNLISAVCWSNSFEEVNCLETKLFFVTDFVVVFAAFQSMDLVLRQERYGNGHQGWPPKMVDYESGCSLTHLYHI